VSSSRRSELCPRVPFAVSTPQPLDLSRFPRPCGYESGAIFPTRGVATQGFRTLCSDSRREPRLAVDTFPLVELVKVIPLVAKLLSCIRLHWPYRLDTPFTLRSAGCIGHRLATSAFTRRPTVLPLRRPVAHPAVRGVLGGESESAGILSPELTPTGTDCGTRRRPPARRSGSGSGGSTSGSHSIPGYPCELDPIFLR
jgi:hypothetical protein